MKAVLVVIDGLGWSEATSGNAVTASTMPFLFGLAAKHGVAELEASGESVGLQEGQTGNSEAGHLTIGAGRRVASLLESIGEAYADGSFRDNPVWQELAGTKCLHVVGLLSDAGVHGYWPNLVRAAELARSQNVSSVYVHAILDGVDSQQGSAPRLLDQLLRDLEPLEGVTCASVMGRRWACDRSGDLSITKVLVDHLRGRHETPELGKQTLGEFLAQGSAEKDFPCHRLANHRFIGEGEAVLLTNHRADRNRQVAEVFAADGPVYSLIELGDAVPAERVFFPKESLREGVAFELRQHGVVSARVAEQCKFPHVTYFFNGFNETLGEDTICLPSVPEASIGDRPEMSARAVTDAVLRLLEEPDRRAILVNLANADQVGHTGRLDAVKQAVGIVDRELDRLHAACQELGWSLLITSDHGNADRMLDEQGRPLGSHSSSPVPLLVVPAHGQDLALANRNGTLANVGATFLTALGLSPPDWMAQSLITFANAGPPAHTGKSA